MSVELRISGQVSVAGGFSDSSLGSREKNPLKNFVSCCVCLRLVAVGRVLNATVAVCASQRKARFIEVTCVGLLGYQQQHSTDIG